PDAHVADEDPVAAQPLGKPGHHAALLFRDARRLWPVRRAVRVTRVTQDPVEREPALAPELPRHLEGVRGCRVHAGAMIAAVHLRSEEHTSELQSRVDLVCRLLLEKKK